MRSIRNICYLFILLLLGCNSHIPVLIKTPPENDLNYQEVKMDVDNYQEQYVRWGGKIVSVQNKADSTWIEILANRLNSYGKPSSSDEYQGRFIARLDGFLDPEHYSEDRKLTIYGKIETNLVRRIDDHPYEYPLVHANEHYLWSEPRPIPYYYSGYYGYHYHPYFRHHYLYHPYSRFHYGLHHYY